MKRRDLLNLGWLIVLLAGVAYVGGVFSGARASEPNGDRRGLPPVAASVRDATGRLLPVRDYARIASASPLGDELLLALAEPERVVALSYVGRQQDPDRHRYGRRALLSGPGDLERLLDLHADLLILQHLGSEAEKSRVLASGIVVFDLGELRGLRTLHDDMLALSMLLGDRTRGERLWQRFDQRFARVAADVPASARKEALYLAVYAGKFYGGTRGTSYHDVLQAAGLRDVAAARFSDWPLYDPEQLLELDPELIVTNTGMRAQLCRDSWLHALRACRRAGDIVELPDGLLGDPGLRMLDAAEALHARVYGAGPPLTESPAEPAALDRAVETAPPSAAAMPAHP